MIGAITWTYPHCRTWVAPEPAEPQKPFVPPRFTSDILAILREASEDVKRSTLRQHLSRRSRVADGSESAVVLDERIAQIRDAMGEGRGAQEVAPVQPSVDVLPIKPQGWKPGPKPDYDTAAQVAQIVASISPSGSWRSELEGICDRLDDENIRRPKPWNSKGHVTWGDCLMSERSLVVKAIDHHLKLAKEHEETTFS